MMLRGILYLLFFVQGAYALSPEKPIVVIIPSYNNLEWYKQNLDSVRTQLYENFHIFYIDDCSPDGTADAVQEYITQWKLEHRITLFRNTCRRGQLYNMYIGVHCCPDDVIIVTLDGDDFFVHESVLSCINKAYDDPNVWLTYGQFVEHPSGNSGFCREIPAVVKKYHSYRYYDWITSHLRTFYAGLFKEIPIGYFIKDGDFLRAACDHALMFALLELAAGRITYIADVLYIYNMANTNNIFRQHPLEQITNAYWARGRKPLKALSYNPITKSRDATNLIYNIHCSFGDIESCAQYLKTIAIAGMNTEYITIWYDAYSAESQQAYTELCRLYGVTGFALDFHGDCKEQMLSYCETLPASALILLTSDGCAWIQKYDPEFVINIMQQTKALGYSFTGIFYDEPDVDTTVRANVPQYISLYNDIWLWKYADSVGTWHQPYAACANLYTIQTICTILHRINGKSALQLSHALRAIPAENPDDIGVCTTHAACSYSPKTKLVHRV